jgi:hypothetical protein
MWAVAEQPYINVDVTDREMWDYVGTVVTSWSSSYSTVLSWHGMTWHGMAWPAGLEKIKQNKKNIMLKRHFICSFRAVIKWMQKNMLNEDEGTDTQLMLDESYQNLLLHRAERLSYISTILVYCVDLTLAPTCGCNDMWFMRFFSPLIAHAINQ